MFNQEIALTYQLLHQETLATVNKSQVCLSHLCQRQHSSNSATIHPVRFRKPRIPSLGLLHSFWCYYSLHLAITQQAWSRHFKLSCPLSCLTQCFWQGARKNDTLWISYTAPCGAWQSGQNPIVDLCLNKGNQHLINEVLVLFLRVCPNT